MPVYNRWSYNGAVYDHTYQGGSANYSLENMAGNGKWGTHGCVLGTQRLVTSCSTDHRETARSRTRLKRTTQKNVTSFTAWKLTSQFYSGLNNRCTTQWSTILCVKSHRTFKQHIRYQVDFTQYLIYDHILDRNCLISIGIIPNRRKFNFRITKPGNLVLTAKRLYELSNRDRFFCSRGSWSADVYYIEPITRSVRVWVPSPATAWKCKWVTQSGSGFHAERQVSQGYQWSHKQDFSSLQNTLFNLTLSYV